MNRDKVIPIKCTAAELERFRRAAAVADPHRPNVSAFLRGLAHDYADKQDIPHDPNESEPK